MPHNPFRLVRSHDIASLKMTVHEYEHLVTKAKHLHIAADNDENVFCVAFRTVPMDSTGVAHILEHTVLCGSERYPVRDPFFMMTRRSLNTFMNAFTGSDWTAYPFASKNRKDFFNLLDVYLDAAFFSRLDELDFQQEGHRLEFQNPLDPQSGLIRRGIVYNEMKGAMSSPVSALWQSLCSHLYPTTTYHYNSGGDPEHIPSLSYEQLKAFYRTHYHPSNAIFITFGNMDPTELQSIMENRALGRFQESRAPVFVDDEQPILQPRRVVESYPLEQEESFEQKTHIVVGWLLGKNTDLQELFCAELLSSILLDNSASPLRHILETTDLGTSPSPLCGLEESSRQMCFVCGIEGSDPHKADQVEQLILDTLRSVAQEGIDQEIVESALHQMELEYREIGGDSLPFGLQIMLQALPAAIHDGDPIALLDIDPVLQELRIKIQDPGFIPDLIHSWFLNNPHRVCLVFQPDATLQTQREEREHAELQQILATMDDRQKQLLVEQASLLQTRQQEIQNEDILPQVGLADVPADIRIPQAMTKHLGDWPGAWYNQETNGLVYLQAILEIAQLPQELMDNFALYTSFLADVGCAGEDYLQTQRRMFRHTGGIGASAAMRGNVDDTQSYRAFLSLSGKALERNISPLVHLLYDFYDQVRFDESRRIRELVAQKRASREQGITGIGHTLALMAATSAISPVAALSHRMRGLLGISRLKQLDRSLDSASALDDLLHSFTQIHHCIQQQPVQFLCVCSSSEIDSVTTNISKHFGSPATNQLQVTDLRGTSDKAQVRQMWITNTQVHFCAKAYPTVASRHPDAAALTVLGGFLRNGYLHRAIREQGGAYGGGAAQDSTLGAFRFYSYRDPRLTETLDDFDRSVEWLLEKEHPWSKVEEAILGVISSLDKPSSPAGEAQKAFHDGLYGRTAHHKQDFRQRVLAVKLQDLQRVAQQYLQPANAHIAVLSHSESKPLAKQLQLELHKI